MVIRFFILQAHYRSTVDFSSEALEAAEKGLQRMQEAYARLLKIPSSAATSVEVGGLRQRCAEAMDDDLNTPFVIAALFDSVKAINTVWDGKGTISESDLAELRDVWKTFAIDILGLRLEEDGSSLQGGDKKMKAFHGAIDLLLGIRLQAKQNKDWATSDKIRNELTALGFQIKDTKDGFEWSI